MHYQLPPMLFFRRLPHHMQWMYWTPASGFCLLPFCSQDRNQPTSVYLLLIKFQWKMWYITQDKENTCSWDCLLILLNDRSWRESVQELCSFIIPIFGKRHANCAVISFATVDRFSFVSHYPLWSKQIYKGGMNWSYNFFKYDEAHW